MKTLIIIAIILSLAGCALPSKLAGDTFAGLPSVQFCQKVHYDREYGKIIMSAECAIPVPVPSGLALGSVITAIKP